MDVGGSEPQNLTNYAVGINDFAPHYAPDGEKIAFTSRGAQTSNPEGDFEVYVMAADGSEPQNLSNTDGGLSDFASDYAPDGEEIVYSSFGVQDSNPEGDFEVYVMNALDGSADQNLTDTAGAVSDFDAAISPGGQKIAFVSAGAQPSNPEGDDEIYKMDANGSDRENLTDNSGVNDVTPDFGKVAKG